MVKGLEGKRVVIGGSRKIDEISLLIEKQGGIPLSRPLQGTVFLAEKEVGPSLQNLARDGADWLIFTTGIGIQTLLDVSGQLQIQELFLNRIKQAEVAARGYKSSNALKRLGITPVAVDEDGTTQGLIQSLANVDFTGKRVMVQLHGETAPRLIKFLEEQGALVETILPYRHIAPDAATVRLLCEEILSEQVDAVCFTTQIQVHSLFAVAREHGYFDELSKAFEEEVIAMAIGKVTAEALSEEGITRGLTPANERMGAMIVELAAYYKELKRREEVAG